MAVVAVWCGLLVVCAVLVARVLVSWHVFAVVVVLSDICLRGTCLLQYLFASSTSFAF